MKNLPTYILIATACFLVVLLYCSHLADLGMDISTTLAILLVFLTVLVVGGAIVLFVTRRISRKLESDDRADSEK